MKGLWICLSGTLGGYFSGSGILTLLQPETFRLGVVFIGIGAVGIIFSAISASGIDFRSGVR